MKHKGLTIRMILALVFMLVLVLTGSLSAQEPPDCSMPAEDGSVRAGCEPTNIEQEIAAGTMTVDAAALTTGVEFGNPPDPNNGNCFPFGCGGPSNNHYQQVYNASHFPGTGRVDKIMFFNTEYSSAAFREADYEIRLSTTSKPVNGLDTANMFNNIGPDETLFYTAHLNGLTGSVITFDGLDFCYDPSMGNLLIDIRRSNVTTSGWGYLDARNGSFGDDSSRAHNYGSRSAHWGLRTNFDFAPSTCPPFNILANPGFEMGEAPWQFHSNGWGGFDTTTFAFDGAFAARVEIGSTASNVQLYQYDLPLEPNQHYQLYFAAKSSDGRDMSLYMHKHGWPYSNYGLNGELIDLTTEWQQYGVDFTTNSLAEADGRLRFWLAPYARAGTIYWFDNVYLLKITNGVPPPPDPDPQKVAVPPPGHCNPPVEGNVLGNPGFEANTLTPWSFYTNGKGYAVPVASSAYECVQSAKVLIKQQGSNVQLFQHGLVLQPNTSYRLRLAAKSSDGRNVRLYLHKHHSPYTNYGLNGLPLDLSTEWQVFVVQFTTTGFSTPVSDGRLRIWLAGSDAPDAQYYFDDVVMTRLTATAAVSESLNDLQSLSRFDNQVGYSGVVKGKLLTSGFFIDDDDAGHAQGAFLPRKQSGAMQCENAQPSRAVLWPADGRMVKVKIVGIGKPTRLAVTSIWQDEAVGLQADGVINGKGALLRAERGDGGNGRIYHVAFNASYRDGTSCKHEVLVTVPLEKGAQDAARDDGPLADSTLP